ncbi:hypothetical protein ACB092_12G199900 [Castanea dentata]
MGKLMRRRVYVCMIDLFSLPVTIQFHLTVEMMVGAGELVRKIGGNDGNRDSYQHIYIYICIDVQSGVFF